MNGFYTLIAVVGLISVLITFFLGRIFKNRIIVKYIPAIIFLFAGLGFLIKAKFFSTTEGFAELGYIILMLIAGIVFIISLITALIMEFIQRKNKRH